METFEALCRSAEALSGGEIEAPRQIEQLFGRQELLASSEQPWKLSGAASDVGFHGFSRRFRLGRGVSDLKRPIFGGEK